MKGIFTGLLLMLASVPLMAGHDEQAEAANAHAAVAEFSQALKTELVSAMQAGGPVAAIEACRSRAPAIAAEVSEARELTVSRVSLRNRNPDNAPQPWQAEVLKSFDQRNARGESPASLTWQETVNSPGETEFRFMKAIPTGGLCLQCHGETIAPEVADKLADAYPEDRATGYKAGDIRGAFVVTRRLDSR